MNEPWFLLYSGHPCFGSPLLCFIWKNLDFEVDVVDGKIKWETLECLVEIVKQVDFPRNHSLRRELEQFVANSASDTS